MFNKINQIIIVSFLMILISCKPNNVLTMERGIYFYENNDFHEASNQFKKVILNYSSDITSLKEKNVEILAQAYHQLALCQSRLAYTKPRPVVVHSSGRRAPTHQKCRLSTVFRK